MVAWVVIDRQHPRKAGPFASLLSTPLIPLPHLSPLLPTPYGHSYTTAAPQPLCNQSLTHSFHRHGGCTPLSRSPERVRIERNLAHSAFPDPVGALRGEGVTVYQENCSQNVAAPASGRKKEMGQAGMPVPQILDGFVLGGEPVLGEQMHGHFAQVPDDAEPGEDLQRVIGDV